MILIKKKQDLSIKVFLKVSHEDYSYSSLFFFIQISQSPLHAVWDHKRIPRFTIVFYHFAPFFFSVRNLFRSLVFFSDTEFQFRPSFYVQKGTPVFAALFHVRRSKTAPTVRLKLRGPQRSSRTPLSSPRALPPTHALRGRRRRSSRNDACVGLRFRMDQLLVEFCFIFFRHVLFGCIKELRAGRAAGPAWYGV